MNRSSSRKVKLTSKFEEFKLTANGKKRGRPRKSWPHDESAVVNRQSMPTTRDEYLRSREENKPTIATSIATTNLMNNSTLTPSVATPITTTLKSHGPRPMSSKKEELLRLREENSTLKRQIEQKEIEFEELKRQTSYTGQTVPKDDYDDLKDKYHRDLTHAKRHEWCVVCLNPSRYYCCWNTTYCSQKCQVSDWYSRHGKSCERTRNNSQDCHLKKNYV